MLVYFDYSLFNEDRGSMASLLSFQLLFTHLTRRTFLAKFCFSKRATRLFPCWHFPQGHLPYRSPAMHEIVSRTSIKSNLQELRAKVMTMTSQLVNV